MLVYMKVGFFILRAVLRLFQRFGVEMFQRSLLKLELPLCNICHFFFVPYFLFYVFEFIDFVLKFKTILFRCFLSSMVQPFRNG